jgi:hypothetical protein
MKPKIALATVSGKAYYLLVKELKKRKIDFLSLLPKQKIPASVEVVITTNKEKKHVNFRNVLVYFFEDEPNQFLDESLRIIQKKEVYEEIKIGIDPGKTFALAILFDKKIMKKMDNLTFDITIESVLEQLFKYPSKTRKVKVGSGLPQIAEKILSALDSKLPVDVVLERVEESRTSNISVHGGFRKKINDMESAVIIAERRGSPWRRKKHFEK